MRRTSAYVRGACGLPADFGAGLVTALNERLGNPVSRLRLGAAGEGPTRSLDEHLDSLKEQATSSSGSLTARFNINGTERAKVFETVSVVFQKMDSHVSWAMGSQTLEGADGAVTALSELWQIEQGGCSMGASTRDRWGKRNLAIRRHIPEDRAQTLRSVKRDLCGVAPVQWFGSAYVEAFGGDSVFEGLPNGWAERVRPGLWKVFGVEDPEDPDAFQVERWSDRERALIEALGPQFFFNVETGQLATEFVEIPVATQYPVHLWDEAAGELVIHEPDGSTRPANLTRPDAEPGSAGEAESGPRALSHLVVERMTEVMGDVFVDDDQLYWVEQHLQVVPELDDTWVEAFSVWLGEHVRKGILDAKWIELDGRWVVSSSRGVFDPEQVVRATVGSEARGESRVMVTSACAAMGVPLP